MKKMCAAMFLLIPLSIIAQQSIQSIDPNELVKRWPADFKDRLTIHYLAPELGPIRMKELAQKAKEENIEYFLQAMDCPEACEFHFDDAQLMYSKSTGEALAYSLRFKIINQDYSYVIRINYHIFEDAKKGKIGARFKLNERSAEFKPEQIGHTYTGKKIGEFCLRDAENENMDRIRGLRILYDKVYFTIEAATADKDFKITGELVERWAKAVLNRIKMGLGEKVEAVNNP